MRNLLKFLTTKIVSHHWELSAVFKMLDIYCIIIDKFDPKIRYSLRVFNLNALQLPKNFLFSIFIFFVLINAISFVFEKVVSIRATCLTI